MTENYTRFNFSRCFLNRVMLVSSQHHRTALIPRQVPFIDKRCIWVEKPQMTINGTSLPPAAERNYFKICWDFYWANKNHTPVWAGFDKSLPHSAKVCLLHGYFKSVGQDLNNGMFCAFGNRPHNLSTALSFLSGTGEATARVLSPVWDPPWKNDAEVLE